MYCISRCTQYSIIGKRVEQKVFLDNIIKFIKRIRDIMLLSYLKVLFLLSSSKPVLNKANRDDNIIVSFTSYPERIYSAIYVATMILNQSMKPDRVVLWLSEDQFPSKALPHYYNKLISRGLEILWCDDLGSHKKYFYTLKNNLNSILITVDDDLFYPKNLISELYEAYQRNPNVICTMRAHQMRIKENNILPYTDWFGDCNITNQARFDLFATGGAGTLYPPHALCNEVLNSKAIKEICFYADDVWLKAMATLNDTPILLCKNKIRLLTIPNTQNNALKQKNVDESLNDTQLAAVFSRYEIYHRLSNHINNLK
ncbi:glycosyl transferase [Clostridia bacterium]|nr:glycosyl transferase [Clostridia bacterium]